MVCTGAMGWHVMLLELEHVLCDGPDCRKHLPSEQEYFPFTFIPRSTKNSVVTPVINIAIDTVNDLENLE